MKRALTAGANRKMVRKENSSGEIVFTEYLVKDVTSKQFILRYYTARQYVPFLKPLIRTVKCIKQQEVLIRLHAFRSRGSYTTRKYRRARRSLLLLTVIPLPRPASITLLIGLDTALSRPTTAESLNSAC